jgi:hypothetical protein
VGHEGQWKSAKGKLYQVKGSRRGEAFTAGFVVKKGMVTRAAPIIRELLTGKAFEEAKALIEGKGWTFEYVLDDE